MKITVFWNVMLWDLADVYQHFGEMWVSCGKHSINLTHCISSRTPVPSLLNPDIVNSQLSGIQAYRILIQLEKKTFQRKFIIFTKLFNNKFSMHRFSLAMSSQLSPAPLCTVLPHADTIAGEATWIHDCVAVHLLKIFHPPVCCVSQETSYTRTKAKMCCFDSVLSFYPAPVPLCPAQIPHDLT
jgi:hypothetical protein